MTFSHAVRRNRTRRARAAFVRRITATLPSLAGIGTLLVAIAAGLAVTVSPLIGESQVKASPLAAGAPVATLVLIVAESRDGYEEFDVASMPRDKCQTIAESIWHAPQSTLGVDPDGNLIPVIDAWCKED